MKDHREINKKFEAALKAKDYDLLEKLMQEYAEAVQKEKEKKIKDNPYA